MFCAACNNVDLWILIFGQNQKKTKGIVPSRDRNVNLISVEIEKQ